MNKYVLFCSLLGVKSLSKKEKEHKNESLIKSKEINESFMLSDSFLSDYSFFVKKFVQSSVFKKRLLSVKGKKIDRILDKNKNFGKASCEFKKKENPEMKFSFPIIPILESILNINKNDLTYDFFESNKDALSDFLNKVYELRVKKWALANIESEVNSCYSNLGRIKNSSDFAELNDRIDDLLEAVNDLKQDINALEEEMESRWNIEKSTWSNPKLYSSFNFLLSFLSEDGLFSLKSASNIAKKEKKIDLSFFSIDVDLKVYPEVKPSISFSLSFLNLLTFCGASFERKDLLDDSLKNSFESLKNIRKIRIKLRKISKKMKKNQILKQKTSKMMAFDKENPKKKIEIKLSYIEECLEYANELQSVFELIILYKKNNNDLMYDCKALLGEKV